MIAGHGSKRSWNKSKKQDEIYLLMVANSALSVLNCSPKRSSKGPNLINPVLQKKGIVVLKENLWCFIELNYRDTVLTFN